MNDYRDLIAACNKNPWLADPENDLFGYEYSFREVSGMDELRDIFIHGNWAIRTGYVLKDLAFIQQANGGDEWLTLKKENGQWRDFESISFRAILVNQGEDYFRQYMSRLIHSSITEYWGQTQDPRDHPQEEQRGSGPSLSV